MSCHVPATPRLVELVNGSEMTADLVTRLTALALMQAHIAAVELDGTVIPILPPSKRAFGSNLAKRIQRRDIFDEIFLRDLETFLDTVDRHVQTGTHIGWEADENHVRGGYKTTSYEPGIQSLAGALRELDLLRDTILASLSGARAVREAAVLLDG